MTVGELTSSIAQRFTWDWCADTNSRGAYPLAYDIAVARVLFLAEIARIWRREKSA